MDSRRWFHACCRPLHQPFHTVEFPAFIHNPMEWRLGRGKRNGNNTRLGVSHPWIYPRHRSSLHSCRETRSRLSMTSGVLNAARYAQRPASDSIQDRDVRRMMHHPGWDMDGVFVQGSEGGYYRQIHGGTSTSIKRYKTSRRRRVHGRPLLVALDSRRAPFQYSRGSCIRNPPIGNGSCKGRNQQTSHIWVWMSCDLGIHPGG